MDLLKKKTSGQRIEATVRSVLVEGNLEKLKKAWQKFFFLLEWVGKRGNRKSYFTRLLCRSPRVDKGQGFFPCFMFREGEEQITSSIEIFFFLLYSM